MQGISKQQIYEDAMTFRNWHDEIGYGVNTVSIKVSITSDGEHHLIPLYTTTKVKGKERHSLGRKLVTPDLQRCNSNPLLIDDTGEYVFGAGERGTTRHEMYNELLFQLLSSTEGTQPEILILVQWLNSVTAQQIEDELKQLDPSIKTTADWEGYRFIFEVDGKRLTELPLVKQFWQRYYISKQEVEKGNCSITGQQTDVITGIMPMKLKGVPGANTSGAAMWSFNGTSYEAYNRKNGVNAPMGFYTAATIHSFLNFLLREKEYYYRLDDGVIVFWGIGGLTLNTDSWFDEGLSISSHELVQSLFLFPATGLPVPCDDQDINNLNFISLKGNAGRIAIESSFRLSISELVKNYCRFQDSQVPGKKPLAPWQVMKACYREGGKASEQIHGLNTAFKKAVLFGTQLPKIYLTKILHLICYETGCTQAKITALKFYKHLREDNGMANFSDPLHQYAYALGQKFWAIGESQVIQQNRDFSTTNVANNRLKLAQNQCVIAPRLIDDAERIYFNLKTVSGDGKKIGLLTKCKKLYDTYCKTVNDLTDSSMLKIKFPPDAQLSFMLGMYDAERELGTPKPKKNISGEEE